MSAERQTAFPISATQGRLRMDRLGDTSLKNVLENMRRYNVYLHLLSVGQGERVGGRWRSLFEAGAAAVYHCLRGDLITARDPAGRQALRELYGEERNGWLPIVSNGTYTGLVQPLIDSRTSGLDRIALVQQASEPYWSADISDSAYRPMNRVSRFHVDPEAFMAGGGLVLAALELEHAARLQAAQQIAP